MILFPFSAGAQDAAIYLTEKGRVAFVSDAPLELIQASNEKVVGAVNISDRSLSFRVPIIEFNGFNAALQKTHFNENFMESDRYPNASLSGKIIEEVDLSVPGRYTVRAKGKLNVHGIEHDRIIRCRLTVTETTINATAEFTVFLDDHNIKIPSILNQKIAEEIKVELDIDLIKR